MRRFLTLVIALQLALCGAVFGQAGSEPNTFGVYFDEDAMVQCSTETSHSTFGFFDAYLILTNPTAANISGFEFRFTFSQVIEDVVYAADFTDNFGIVELVGGPDWSLSLPSPVPSAPILLVGTHAGAAFGVPQEFFLDSVESFTPTVAGHMCYFDADNGDAPVIMTPPITPTPLDGIAVHGDCAVPTDESSWGAIRSLYR